MDQLSAMGLPSSFGGQSQSSSCHSNQHGSHPYRGNGRGGRGRGDNGNGSFERGNNPGNNRARGRGRGNAQASFSQPFNGGTPTGPASNSRGSHRARGPFQNERGRGGRGRGRGGGIGFQRHNQAEHPGYFMESFLKDPWLGM